MKYLQFCDLFTSPLSYTQKIPDSGKAANAQFNFDGDAMDVSGNDHHALHGRNTHLYPQSLAVELAPHVLVNGIAPGAALWPEGVAITDEEEKLKSIPPR